jgi:hypothetical protein
MKGGSHLCAENYCRQYRPAARMPQAIDTSTSHLGFRCIMRVPTAQGWGSIWLLGDDRSHVSGMETIGLRVQAIAAGRGRCAVRVDEASPDKRLTRARPTPIRMCDPRMMADPPRPDAADRARC